MTLDFNMSGFDGFEVVNFIRQDLGNRDMKILVISSEAEFSASNDQLSHVDGFCLNLFQMSRCWR